MGFIICRSIKLLAFWILFQFSRISVTQSITICLQVKAVLLNLQRYHFQSCTAIQRHIIRNMKHFLLLFPLLHLPLTSSSPCIRPFRCAQEKKKEKKKIYYDVIYQHFVFHQNEATHKWENKQWNERENCWVILTRQPYFCFCEEGCKRENEGDKGGVSSSRSYHSTCVCEFALYKEMIEMTVAKKRGVHARRSSTG